MGWRIERLVAGGTCLVLAAEGDGVPTVLQFGPVLDGDLSSLLAANRPQRLSLLRPAGPRGFAADR